ncbi:hypothetical protein [Saccharothrix luteola]|uniref:hypothetical protein n=1 Tax=Saccharothrix luteola TaxID=2893018 RepID=UPI001E35120D|nr:hypothetical protein [Saccharothrix luteola]MCC8249751.1 hypothetical protein [Saccharothrix luteola]
MAAGSRSTTRPRDPTPPWTATARRAPAARQRPDRRDGNQPPATTPHTLSHLSAAPDRQGVVTLRFDQYGSGRTGLGAYEGRPEDLDHPAFVRQAAAAYRLLRAEPVTDPRALFVAGHSEGALTGLLLAEEVLPRPASLVLLQPQAVRLLDLIALQPHARLAAAARAGQISPEQQLVNDQGVDRAVSALRANEPFDPTGLLPVFVQFFQALFYGPGRRFVLSNDRVHPPTAAGRLHSGTQVLLTFDEEFSRFTKSSGRWRDPTPEALLGRWSRFVDECEQGYPRDAGDYANDLTSRDALERALTSAELQIFPEMSRLRESVEEIDARFRALLIPDVFPGIPNEFWWARGMVKSGARRFVEDVRREYRTDLIETE